MRQNVTFIHTYYSELFACTNWIFVLDCGDQKFYDRQDSSLQLKTDSSDGKLQISIQLIDWLIDRCVAYSGKYFTYIQYENKLNHY